ncbi:MAG: RNA 2',3'-cyclic phosphodiesterase [Lysobacter spongiicola]|nr:RNA 2',3'-cyclic phosphodiesterase [Lysobacter spongiicola]
MQSDLQPPDLFGPAAETQRLFFALWPSGDLRKRIADEVDHLQARHAVGGRRLRPARYHLTLQFLGDFSPLPPDLLHRACQAARSAAQELAPFDLALDRSGAFGATGWLGCSNMPTGLRRLWEVLGRCLVQAGIPPKSGRTLVPHVTVIRDSRVPLATQDVGPLPWAVDRFVLVRSAGGNRVYTVEGEWPLVGRDDDGHD